VRCAVQDVIAKHTVQIEQQQKIVQRIDQQPRRVVRMN
jgi:hypothetical protein